MKQTLTLMILVPFILFDGYCQTEKLSKDQALFDLALEYSYDEDYDSALIFLNKLLVEYPTSTLYPRAKYNIGYIYVQVDSIDSSIPVFKDILNSDFNEFESYGGIIEQYTLYKHRSAKHLAQIYLDKEDYLQAIKYINIFAHRYKYKHFCGNELSANEIYTAYSYARYFFGIGKYEKAIKKLIPHTFYNGLANNDYILELLDEILQKNYSSEDLGYLFNQAKASLRINKKGDASILLFGEKIAVYNASLFAIDNLEFEKNIELSQRDAYQKAIETNPIFEKYI